MTHWFAIKHGHRPNQPRRIIYALYWTSPYRAITGEERYREDYWGVYILA